MINERQQQQQQKLHPNAALNWRHHQLAAALYAGGLVAGHWTLPLRISMLQH